MFIFVLENHFYRTMITLYLARHGQTEENIARIFQGHLPGTLTDEGKEQARLMGKQLENISLDCIVSSDLQRVVDTVQIAMHGRFLPWEKTVLLREVDWGKWTGLKIDSVKTSELPDDVETREMLYERAGRFLSYLKENYDGKNVLAVAHGLINRSIQGNIEGVELEKIFSVPHMKNAEVRKFIIE